MKKLVTAVLVTLSFGAFASSASATTFKLTDYSVIAHATDPGLVMWVDELLAPDYTFDLQNEGDSQTVELFKLGSSETWGNMGEDSTPYPISVGFTFSAPVFGSGGSTATGNTAGLFFLGGVLWNSPLVMTFGTTGVLGIALEDAIFGLPGSSTIDATFKLLQKDVAAAPVPEPASMLLFGSGLAAGAAMLRRRSRRAA